MPFTTRFHRPQPWWLALASLTLAATGACAQTAKLWGSGGGDLSYVIPGVTIVEGARNFDTSGNGMGDTSDNFWVYCLDRNTSFVGGTTYNVLTGLDAFFVNPVFGTPATTSYYRQQVSTGAYAATNSYGDATNQTVVRDRINELFRYAYADGMSSNVKSAAFQYALWEIEGDATLSRTAGFAQQTSGDTALFNQIDTYLTALNTHNWGTLTAQDYTYTIYAALNASQTQITVKPVTPTRVPEPTMPLTLAAVGCAALAARRRRQTSVA